MGAARMTHVSESTALSRERPFTLRVLGWRVTTMPRRINPESRHFGNTCIERT